MNSAIPFCQKLPSMASLIEEGLLSHMSHVYKVLRVDELESMSIVWLFVDFGGFCGEGVRAQIQRSYFLRQPTSQIK